MSGSGQRDAVFPTRMTLAVYKGKEQGAKKGYDLLKKKSDALTVRLRGLLKEIKKVGRTFNKGCHRIAPMIILMCCSPSY